MKRVCWFVIMVLLAVEFANATPMAAQEPGLVKGMKRTSGSATKAEIQAGGMKEGGLVGKKCITLEYCKKKMMMMTCAKECRGVSQGLISKKHFPGKCFLKCKKCIPTC